MKPFLPLLFAFALATPLESVTLVSIHDGDTIKIFENGHKVSVRQIANYESGKTPIKPFVEKQLKSLAADILGQNVASDKALAPISSAPQPLAYSDSLSINANYYPDISVSAGYGLAIFGKIEATPINIPANLLGNIVGLDLKKQYDALRVVGDSMLPYIHDGELALIERTEIAQNGNVVVAHIGENLFIKYFERHPLGKWVKLRSHNKEYSDIELVGDEIEMLRIVGVLRATINVNIKVF